jgi:hypothetical protein
MARPLKKIDAEKVRELAEIGCSRREVAGMLGCAEATIRARFRAVFELAECCAKIKIRRWQMNAAESGSVPMLIHLGKHLLGQEDRPRSIVEHTGELKVIVEYTDGDPDPGRSWTGETSGESNDLESRYGPLPMKVVGNGAAPEKD